MSDVAQPPFADFEAGLIVAHGRGGLEITINFYEADGTTEKDVSEATLYFEVEGEFRVALGAGEEDHQRVLALTRAQVQAIGTDARKAYVLLDETGAIPACVRAGHIRVTGFLTQPS